MKNYLLLSDGHFSPKLCPVEIEMILRLVIKLIGSDTKLAKTIIDHYQMQRHRHMWKALKHASNHMPYYGLLSMGDNMQDWDYHGLNCDEKIQEATFHRDNLIDYFDLSEGQQIWVPGNHDIGYQNSTLSPLGPASPSQEKFSAFSDIFGPPYGCIELDDYFSFLWISTAHIETLIATPGNIDDVQLEFLINQQSLELAFLEETLDNLQGKFFLGVHDPGSFVSPQLSAILNRHTDKLAGSFTGHIHAEWLMKLAKIIRPSFRSAFTRYKVQFIPSIWGIVLPLFFWPIGAGWARLQLDDQHANLLLHTVGIKKTKTFALC